MLHTRFLAITLFFNDVGDALEPLKLLAKELTPEGAWSTGPEGKALAKLPSLRFAWHNAVRTCLTFLLLLPAGTESMKRRKAAPPSPAGAAAGHANVVQSR